MKSKTIYPRKLLIALTDAQYHKLCAIANARHHGQLGGTVRALIDRRKAPVALADAKRADELYDDAMDYFPIPEGEL